MHYFLSVSNTKMICFLFLRTCRQKKNVTYILVVSVFLLIKIIENVCLVYMKFCEVNFQFQGESYWRICGKNTCFIFSLAVVIENEYF